MNVPHFRFIETHQSYTGAQLRPHWTAEAAGVWGDAVVSWVGPCEVSPEEMVDVGDRLAAAAIRAEEMLHFVCEHFDLRLVEAVLLQRLLVCLAEGTLAARGVADLRRDGDDLYVGGGKLTVSVATVSAVSALIHFGVNVRSETAPVETACLSALGVEPRSFAEALGEAYRKEISGVLDAAWRTMPR